ncbi:MAG TPA: hypothetical protein VMH05_06685 [Bryobacteraceae bacterium]|nr:hypothetical protein [Bryobacteraceae bacterium]
MFLRQQTHAINGPNVKQLFVTGIDSFVNPLERHARPNQWAWVAAGTSDQYGVSSATNIQSFKIECSQNLLSC